MKITIKFPGGPLTLKINDKLFPRPPGGGPKSRKLGFLYAGLDPQEMMHQFSAQGGVEDISDINRRLQGVASHHIILCVL